MRSLVSLLAAFVLTLTAVPVGAASLFITNTKGESISVIDTTTLEVTATIPLGKGKPNRVVFHPDGKTLWTAAGENKAVLKIDTATNKPVASIALPGVVHEATLTLDGRYLYTTLRKVNKIAVVDTTTDKIATIIPQKGYPDLVTMEPTGRYALVTNRYADLVAVIDVKTHTQVRTIPVGKAPHGMALRPR